MGVRASRGWMTGSCSSLAGPFRRRGGLGGSGRGLRASTGLMVSGCPCGDTGDSLPGHPAAQVGRRVPVCELAG